MGRLSAATLRTKAQAPASAGSTEQALAVAVTDRGWNGAHGVAVLTWLNDLASVEPPRTEANHASRTIALRLRAEAARAKSTAAGPDSQARRQARELADWTGP